MCTQFMQCWVQNPVLHACEVGTLLPEPHAQSHNGFVSYKRRFSEGSQAELSHQAVGRGYALIEATTNTSFCSRL